MLSLSFCLLWLLEVQLHLHLSFQLLTPLCCLLHRAGCHLEVEFSFPYRQSKEVFRRDRKRGVDLEVVEPTQCTEIRATFHHVLFGVHCHQSQRPTMRSVRIIMVEDPVLRLVSRACQDLRSSWSYRR